MSILFKNNVNMSSSKLLENQQLQAPQSIWRDNEWEVEIANYCDEQQEERP